MARRSASIALAVLLGIGTIVVGPAPMGHAEVPELRSTLVQVNDVDAFSSLFEASGSVVIAGDHRSHDGGLTWTRSGLRSAKGWVEPDMFLGGGHLTGYDASDARAAAPVATDYDMETGSLAAGQVVLPGVPLAMNSTWMLYRPSGKWMAFDFVHNTPAVALQGPAGTPVMPKLQLTASNGIFWMVASSTTGRLVRVAYSTSPTAASTAWVLLTGGGSTPLYSSAGVDATNLRYVAAGVSGLSFCTLTLAALTSAPTCLAVDAADHTGATVTTRDYGSWSLVAVDRKDGTGTKLYAWSDPTVVTVQIPANSSVAAMSKGDVAHVVLGGATSSLIRVNPDGSLGTPAVWPTRGLVPAGLAVTPDRVVGYDFRNGAPPNVAWSRSTTAGSFGPEVVLPRGAMTAAASAGRTVVAGPDGTSVYDRGVLATTIPTTSWPASVSGPYVTTPGIPNLWTADGQSLYSPMFLASKTFGSRALEGWYKSDTSPNTYSFEINDLTGTEPARSVDVPTGVACYSFFVWGELATIDCLDHTLRVFNLTTGTLVASRGTADVDSLAPVAMGDGYVIYFDYPTRSYGLWRLSDSTTTPLTECANLVTPATDGVGHVVCASTSELIWRDFSAISTSAGRVLGWLAPTSFSSGVWTPQIDVTKPFSAGTMRIRKGTTVVKDISVPASSDGSMRGVSWDGTTTEGTVAPTGVYTAELIVSGKDGSGAVRAVDGTSPPTFQLVWTGPGPTVGLSGSFVPLSPARLLDTRITPGAVGRNSTIDVQVTGRGGVPATGVGAVILNVTAVTPKAPGFLTIYPSGAATPNASNLNFTAGQVVPNLVLAKVGAGGRVTIRNSSLGATHVVADVSGYFVDGAVTDPGGVAALSPSRLLDTRDTFGVIPQMGVTVNPLGRGGVPMSGVAAVIVNITAVGTYTGGFLTAYPTGGAVPNTSTVNFLPRQIVPNLAFVRLGKDGSFTVTNQSLWYTHVVVDVVGYVMSGIVTGAGMYVPLAPARVLDTRPDYGGSGAVGANSARNLTVAGVAGMPATGVSAVVANVTVVAYGSGFITVYPADVGAPNASNLNFTAGQVVPNLVAVKTSTSGAIAIRNSSLAANHVVVDVAGYFTA